MVNSRADIARRYNLTRARVTQVMNLLKLPDPVQEHLVGLPVEQHALYPERRLREIVGIRDDGAQARAFEELVGAREQPLSGS